MGGGEDRRHCTYERMEAKNLYQVKPGTLLAQRRKGSQAQTPNLHSMKMHCMKFSKN